MNKALIIGRLSKDVEVKYAGELAVGRTTIAVDRKTKEKAADFISLVAFGKTAVALEKVVKGQKVGIEGHIQTGSYLKQDGTKVYTTDVIVDAVEYLEKKETNELPKDSLPEFPKEEQKTVDDFFSADNVEGLPFN